ncbi:MAG: hypothetical protein WBX01_10720 [Nitrososphaeraceae archaeon]
MCAKFGRDPKELAIIDQLNGITRLMSRGSGVVGDITSEFNLAFESNLGLVGANKNSRIYSYSHNNPQNS